MSRPNVGLITFGDNRKHEWENLSSDDHSDYKAQFFGWERAFDNKKVFST